MRDIPTALRRRAEAIDASVRDAESHPGENWQVAAAIGYFLAEQFRALADEVERTGE